MRMMLCCCAHQLMVYRLQCMLYVCVTTADMLSLKFNPLKSHCLAIESMHHSVFLQCCCIPTLYLGFLLLNISEFTLSVVGSYRLTLPQLNSHFLLLVTVFMLRLRALMRRCIYPSESGRVLLPSCFNICCSCD